MIAPEHDNAARSVGETVRHASFDLLRSGRIEDYLECMASVLHENVRYRDPVHALCGRAEVLDMLRATAPRVANSEFDFELLCDQQQLAVWRWRICLRVRFARAPARIEGVVCAKIRSGRIFDQREYFDPMESLSLSRPIQAWYKKILRGA